MIVAILQARFSSTRLPGKVLFDVHGKPMIIRQIDRILQSKKIDKLILATSLNDDDDELCDIVSNYRGVEIYRGDLDNVLDRFYQAVKNINPQEVVRLTGDCPLVDAEIIDQIIELHFKSSNDYTSNTLPPSYPDGLDVEIFSFEALTEAWKSASLPSELEHVTSYIRKNPEKYKIGNLQSNIDYSKIRLTVDEIEDYNLILHVYKNFLPDILFSFNEIIAFLLKNKALLKINSMHLRNSGSNSSIEKDKKHLERIEKKLCLKNF